MSRFKIYETPRGYELKEIQEVWVGEFAKRDHAEMFRELFEGDTHAAPDPQDDTHEEPEQVEEQAVDAPPSDVATSYLKTMRPLAEISDISAAREEMDVVTRLAGATGNAEQRAHLKARFEGLQKRKEDIEREVTLVTEHASLFALGSPERLQLDALKEQMVSKHARLLAEKHKPAKQPATPPPAWKKEPAQQAKPKNTSELQAAQLEAILDSIDLREGVSLSALHAFADQQSSMSSAEFVQMLDNLEKAGEVIVLKKLPGNTSRVFRNGVVPKDREPMMDLEERVYDLLLTKFFTNEDKRLCDVAVDALGKHFKGSDKRDCVKALETLHTKGWLCQLHSTPSRRVVHMLPE